MGEADDILERRRGETEKALDALRNRLRVAVERGGREVRITGDTLYVLRRVLERAYDLRDDPAGLVRESEAAAFILTGEWPRPASQLDGA